RPVHIGGDAVQVLTKQHHHGDGDKRQQSDDQPFPALAGWLLGLFPAPCHRTTGSVTRAAIGIEGILVSHCFHCAQLHPDCSDSDRVLDSTASSSAVKSIPLARAAMGTSE